MTISKLPPCKGCEERHQGCHAGCSRYKMWAEERAEQREKIRATRRKEWDFYGYASSLKKKLKKGGGK